MSNKKTNILAIILLLICFLISVFSIQNLSLTMDEQAHIPSGYSYLKYQDYRLNPEHPPLAKDLSAIPLLFMNPNFPTDHECWTENINGQWVCGSEFVFKSGNNADLLIFLARMPMIFLLILLGWLVFFITKKIAGNKPALLALFLFSFSPTLIAHGRLVTTDIAAAFGALLATYFWIKFLKKPNKKNVLVAGLCLGIALVLKFSLILLLPSLGIATIIYALLAKRNILRYIFLSVLAGLVAVFLIIYPLYFFHVSNYPTQRQINDTVTTLSSSAAIMKNTTVWLVENPITRPLGQYMLGLTMATQRVAGGNTVYYMGQVSGEAWASYFPMLYLLKVPLSLHIMSLIALMLWLGYLYKKKAWKKPVPKAINWTKEHILELSLLAFFAIYWLTSITGNLNIGVRHILPTIPIVHIFVAIGLYKFIEPIKTKNLQWFLKIIIVLLLAWYMVSCLINYPLYISYYNELAGGSKNGYKYAVDSNYDWGQDLKRLKDFVEENDIEKISVTYFGGDNVYYRLGDKIEKTWLYAEPGLNHGWIAISATFFQENRAEPAPGYDKKTDSLEWLNDYSPAGRAGHSIFIYNLD